MLLLLDWAEERLVKYRAERIRGAVKLLAALYLRLGAIIGKLTMFLSLSLVIFFAVEIEKYWKQMSRQ
jgi:hypothetical protein